MSSSELSELTSAASSDVEDKSPATSKGKLEHYFKQGASGSLPLPNLKKKRPPSPPHEYVLADNPDIAFICMFRSRFSDAFPKSLPHYGPQDIETGITGTIAGEHVERLLCALLSLVLNRKKDVERGHYGRALEEAIHVHASEWPVAWQGKSPLSGSASFNSLLSAEKLTLLRTLVLWSLEHSEAIKTIIKDSYKQARHEDDLNQPLSVQSWGRDGDKRRFWLIEGQDDTHFRLYRESNPSLKTVTWRSVAGTIDEIKEVAAQLGSDRTQASRRLHDRILAAVPRFEAGEDKQRRRDYRMARKAQFTRPDPGFSLYEGRTRGKRVKYNYSDDEGAASDEPSSRRSNRQSGLNTPSEPAGPTFTASGRQVISRHNGPYGDIQSHAGRNASNHDLTNGDSMDLDDEDENNPTQNGTKHNSSNGRGGRSRSAHNLHELSPGNSDDDEDVGDASSEDAGESSAEEEEWDGGGDEAEEIKADDDEDDDEISDDEKISEDDFSVHDANGQDDSMDDSLVVRLRYQRSDGKDQPTNHDTSTAPHIHDRPLIVNGNTAPMTNEATSASLEPPNIHVPAPSVAIMTSQVSETSRPVEPLSQQDFVNRQAAQNSHTPAPDGMPDHKLLSIEEHRQNQLD